MGQHKTQQKLARTRLFLSLVVGVLIAAACAYRMIYYQRGIIGSRALGGLIGIGIALMLAPFWAYFHDRRRRSRN
jgi:hypothetical protein